MKSILLSVFVALGFVQFSQADDVTVTITKVHLCCDSCVKGVDKALADVDGVKGVCDKKAQTVVLTAADKATLQKAADALVKAGYFGKCSDESIKIDDSDRGPKAKRSNH